MPLHGHKRSKAAKPKKWKPSDADKAAHAAQIKLLHGAPRPKGSPLAGGATYDPYGKKGR